MRGALILLTVSLAATSSVRRTLDNTGLPAGLLSNCPGVMKNASISKRMLKELNVIIHQVTPQGLYRRRLTYQAAAKAIATDKNIDLKNKPTVMYFVGFMDSTMFVHNRAIGTGYARRGYNVLLLETLEFTAMIYPKAVRVAHAVGKKAGELLVKLSQSGLEAERLELVGASLGAHIAAYAAKHFYQTTGRKVSRMTGLDVAGPCLRNLPPEDRFSSLHAERVDAIHTNIDGFGLANPVGHIDIYVNGGEFQPNDILEIPCLVICSHLRAIVYWWIALDNPKKFLAMRCASVQDARDAKCYNGTHETNYLGLEADFSSTGLFYLGTRNEYPYYSGRSGLKEENEVYSSHMRALNLEDELVV